MTAVDDSLTASPAATAPAVPARGSTVATPPVATSSAAALADRRRRAGRGDDGAHRLARAVGDPAGRRARQPGPAALHPSRRRHRRALLGRRSGLRRQPALPVAAHALVLLGPPGRQRRRGGRRVLRPHPDHRLALGPPGVGRVVDVGRPADLDRAAADPRDRLPGAASGAGRSPHPRPPLCRRRAARRRRRAHRPLLGRLVEHAAPGRDHSRSGFRPPRPRLHALDDAAELHRLLVDLRVAAGDALPHRGARGRGGGPGARGVAGRALERGHRPGRCRRGGGAVGPAGGSGASAGRPTSAARWPGWG